MNPFEKALREKIAIELTADLKCTMENLCGLGRGGYDKVDQWHESIINTIKKGKTK
jgi:hypothetical protein